MRKAYLRACALATISNFLFSGHAAAQPCDFWCQLWSAIEEGRRAEGSVDDPATEADESAGAGSDGRVSREASSRQLPSPALSEFLETVPADPAAQVEKPYSVRVTEVSSDSIYFEEIEESITAGEGDPGIDQVIQDETRLLILFRSTVTPAEASSALQEYSLRVVTTIPGIGAVSVDGAEAIERFGYARSGGSATTFKKLRKSAVNRLAQRLRRDPRFEAVTPELVLTTTQIRSVITPQDSGPDNEDDAITAGDDDLAGDEIASESATVGGDERLDWGIEASKVNEVWGLLTADPVIVGVVDAGFADHEDLPLTRGSDVRWRRSNHGNHVAGIMCARHNGRGARGVIPNCEVRAATNSFALSSVVEEVSDFSDDEVRDTRALFGQFLASIDDFIEKNPDAKVVNVSLGLNWMPRYGKDPRSKESKQIRKYIQEMSIFAYRILARAKARDIIIFSAAGNDSTDLRKIKTPIDAKWSSPINFASLMIQNTDGWSNAVVVEAYDKNEKRAKMSNVAGAIACPGKDIFSATAQKPDSYGMMSGTSMASPYCAAAFAALRSINPDVPVRRLLACFLNPPSKIENRVPKMDLKAATIACGQI
jgi:hypothetical protein